MALNRYPIVSAPRTRTGSNVQLTVTIRLGVPIGGNVDRFGRPIGAEIGPPEVLHRRFSVDVARRRHHALRFVGDVHFRRRLTRPANRYVCPKYYYYSLFI